MTPTPGLMPRWRRALLFVVGVGLAAGALWVLFGGLDASKERQEYLSKGYTGVALLFLLGAGVVTVFSSIYGALPDLKLGNYGVGWPPPVDVLLRLEALAAENQQLRSRSQRWSWSSGPA